MIQKDPSDEMLKLAKKKLQNDTIEFLCAALESIHYRDCFDVVTAIQSHHYMQADEETKAFELRRWGKYQQRHGKTGAEAKAHNERCGVKYFPLTVNKHIRLLEETGFRKIHVFWYSYMQMGIYGIK